MDFNYDVFGDEECKKHFLTHCPKNLFELYSKLNKYLMNLVKDFHLKIFILS